MIPKQLAAIAPHSERSLKRQSSWKLALLAGFVTQLLLILFVTTIGLQQLNVAAKNLNEVVDVHMRKQNLTKTMEIAARQRTIIMFMLSKTEDPFERDELLMRFNQRGSEFVSARLQLMELPLNENEQQLIAQQRHLIAYAQPIQEQVIDLISADFNQKAIDLVLRKSLPAQNDVMAVLAKLDAETQRMAFTASREANRELERARYWMYWLSGAALLMGLFVAAIVLRYTNRVSHEREQLATHDTLTCLPNRMMFMDRLEQSIIRAKRNQTLVGIMFIDIDRFKRVNDTLGHAHGDQLICAVAQRLREVVRADDTVARLGGDEFVVVISDVVSPNPILQVVEKMLLAVSQPYRLDGREIFSSCSIGVSIFPDDGITSGDLLKHADTAMYHAKNSGRNRFQLYNAAMNAMAEERLQLETDLHHAMERDEFVFHYQPQLNLETGHLHGVEALIRWRHPDKGLLYPKAFLGMLEETSEIINVGHHLLMTACQQTVEWHAAGYPDLIVAINVSGREFWDDNLVSSVCDALAKSGLPAHSLQLELTEGIFMEDIDKAEDRILALKAVGITVAIDDFGTGYSSLAHLRRFPLDVLKIDRYFVQEIHLAPANEALVNSILALCKGLSLGTVAEGIENRAQLDSLRKLGCQIMQGHLISPPVPADKIAALLSRDWKSEFDFPRHSPQASGV